MVFLKLWILTVTWFPDANAQDQFLSKGGMEVYTPDYLWNFDMAHHGVSDNPHSLYATLHNVELDLVNGPAYPNGVAGALRFYGNQSSYAVLSNTGGVLNATSLFTWAMVIRGDSTTGQGVILEYWDGVGGFRIRQAGLDIVVEAQDTLNRTHTVTVQDAFKNLEWKFFAISFINFDPTLPKSVSGFRFRSFLDAIDAVAPAQGSSDVTVPTQTVLRGTGDVRLGASSDSSMPAFAGRIACLRYHDMWALRFHKDAEYPLTCDPAGTFQDGLATLGEYTVDYVETTTVMSTAFTTETTIGQQTAQQTTEQQITKQSTQQQTSTPQSTRQQTTQQSVQQQTTRQSTQQETTEQSTHQKTTAGTTDTAPVQQTAEAISQTTRSQTADSETSGGPVTEQFTTTASSRVTVRGQTATVHTIPEACYQLQQQSGSTFLQSPAILDQLIVNSFGACVDACILQTGCIAISMEKAVKDNSVSGTCVLAGIGYTVVGDPDFYLFRFT